MKSTWFGSKPRKEFAALIHDADDGMSDYEKYAAWVRCVYCCFVQACHKFQFGKMDDAVEQEYLKTIGKVKRPKQFAHALGVLTGALEDEPNDFLGTVLSEWDQNELSWRGQCFTPGHLSKVIAMMMMGDAAPVSGKTLWLAEPACGAGSMVIAASEVLKQQGFYPWHYHWAATDVDWRCYAMTLIQTTLLGIPCHCIHGNTLSMEVFDSRPNLISMMHPPKKRISEQPLKDLADNLCAFFRRAIGG